MKLLIANRGEIAIRIARAADELGWQSVMVHSQDDDSARHLQYGNDRIALPGTGPRSYLNIGNVIEAARKGACGYIHPGYGFLSESAELARACAEADIEFVGPSPDILDLLGDKSKARAAAARAGVPIPKGLEGPVTLEEAQDFLASLGDGGAVMVKAILGGGGRGTRPATCPDELTTAFATCQAEAKAAFGSGELYVEELITQARHIEVQIVGDKAGQLIHLFDRECTLQRNRQKLVEIAPSPSIRPETRERLYEASLTMAREVGLTGLGTFEFLVRERNGEEEAAFIEANPRVQVEHTITEEITGADLVRTQLEIASGLPLTACQGLMGRRTAPLGRAIQCRINAETINRNGQTAPAGATVTRFEPPMGPSIRVDTSCHQGYTPNPAFDTLLAKIIVHERSDEYAHALAKAKRALEELTLAGCETNRAFMRSLLSHPAIARNEIDTGFIDRSASELVATAEEFEEDEQAAFPSTSPAESAHEDIPAGSIAVTASFAGVVAECAVGPGDLVRKGTSLLLLEAMKMQHPVTAPSDGIVMEVRTNPGDTVAAGRILIVLAPETLDEAQASGPEDIDPEAIRPDLAEVNERHRNLTDAARPEAVTKRHERGARTARENISDLCDDGSFTEYGGLTIAAQRSRHAHDKLVELSPADGMVAGFGSVNGEMFPGTAARCAIFSYDYTVMAGTQGALNHKKKDRVLELTDRAGLPLIIFGEGGGGRPGDVDIRLGLDVPTFARFARLKDKAPIIGIVSGYCFAGNAALAGCADILIATENSSIGMGGPAMIEGGGLGKFHPRDVGPIDIQTKNGVVDIPVKDETEAVATAKKVLSYFQGPLRVHEHGDQRMLRHIIPENRKRVFSTRHVIETLCDTASVQELKAGYGTAMITALVRIGGHPLGLIANDNQVLSGAIDAEAAAKAADFLDLCETRRLPVLSLCDTPGFMVGPEVEKKGQVREACRLFVAGAKLTVPFFTIVLRKAYGLGAQAMVGGYFHAPFFSVAWPTGEFGAMGLEGAVELGFKRELEKLTDENEKAAFFQQKLDEYYEDGKALTVAEYMEIDDVIDPADTRDWILNGLLTTEFIK